MTAYASRRLVLAVLGSLVVLAPCPAATDSPPAEARDTITRQLPLARGGRLTVDTTHGDITIQSWDRAGVELRAERTADSAADLSALPVEIRALPDQITIASRAPAYAPDLRVRVDYRLRVPAAVDLKLLKTDTGRVAIGDVTGRAIIRVMNGTVRIRGFAGPLDASTVNGEIDVEVARLERGDSIMLETYNGDILVRVPGGAKAHYALRTLNGTIDSNVPLPVLSSYGPHVVHETGGVEDPVIRLQSANGSIRVTR